ncbi:MAG: cobalamin-dependent protein [Chloroflexales bacterium]
MDSPPHDTMMNVLVQALLDGDRSLSVSEIRRLLAAGVAIRQILSEGVEVAMAQLDAKCTIEQFNLLEIMLCGRAVMGIMKELYPPDMPVPHTKATVVVATLEGDVHDLGKNILKMILTASSYRVIDCGKDCPVDRLVDMAERETPLAVGVSGLLTTVMPQVRRVRQQLAERGLGHIKVVAGGAALKQATAENLHVDYIAQNAFEALHYLDDIAGDGR